MKGKTPLAVLAMAIILLAASSIPGCVQQSAVDPNAEVPPGDPAFPPQKEYGIHDPYHVLSSQTIDDANKILERLSDQHIAQIAVLIQYGVHHPDDYATHYGRHIELGEIDRDNGLVYLIRPDADPQEGRITVSIGRGLPKFTAVDAHQIMKEASMDYINNGDYDQGVLNLIKNTDNRLREIYGGAPNGE